MKRFFYYFTVAEWLLWTCSVALIVTSYCIFDDKDPLTLAASLVGVTSLIFIAKGNPIGQALMLAFGVLYAIISYTFAYYGEMITYAGMTAPLAAFALITWLRHPYRGNRGQVQVARLRAREYLLWAALTAAVTFAFYWILRAFHTANLIPSTISVATSFFACCLTFRRSPYFALAYAANDLVLIALWILAAREEIGYLSVVLCFAAFLVNDLYGFFNWMRMGRAQSAPPAQPQP